MRKKQIAVIISIFLTIIYVAMQSINNNVKNDNENSSDVKIISQNFWTRQKVEDFEYNYLIGHLNYGKMVYIDAPENNHEINHVYFYLPFYPFPNSNTVDEISFSYYDINGNLQNRKLVFMINFLNTNLIEILTSKKVIDE